MHTIFIGTLILADTIFQAYLHTGTKLSELSRAYIDFLLNETTQVRLHNLSELCILFLCL
jgi:hypothetical protein